MDTGTIMHPHAFPFMIFLSFWDYIPRVVGRQGSRSVPCSCTEYLNTNPLSSLNPHLRSLLTSPLSVAPPTAPSVLRLPARLVAVRTFYPPSTSSIPTTLLRGYVVVSLTTFSLPTRPKLSPSAVSPLRQQPATLCPLPSTLLLLSSPHGGHSTLPLPVSPSTGI